MANPYSRCGKCKGNMWAPGQMEHIHLADPGLKHKYLVKKHGRSVPATPRTNAARNKGKTLRPRRRAYGPF